MDITFAYASSCRTFEASPFAAIQGRIVGYDVHLRAAGALLAWSYQADLQVTINSKRLKTSDKGYFKAACLIKLVKSPVVKS